MHDGKARQILLTAFVKGIRLNSECENCGENHPGCLNWYDKEMNIKTPLQVARATRSVKSTIEILSHSDKILCLDCSGLGKNSGAKKSFDSTKEPIVYKRDCFVSTLVSLYFEDVTGGSFNSNFEALHSILVDSPNLKSKDLLLSS